MQSKIGRLLIQQNLVTSDQLQEALDLQRETGRRLGDNLVKLNYLRHGASSSIRRDSAPAAASIAETGIGDEFLIDLTD